MKALTLLQPWATAVAWAQKRIENRGWWPPLDLVGAQAEPIAIHAAAESAWNAEAQAVGVELDAWLADASVCNECGMIQARLADGSLGWTLQLQGAACQFGSRRERCAARRAPRFAAKDTHDFGAVVAVARIVGVVEVPEAGPLRYSGTRPSWSTPALDRDLQTLRQNRWLLGPVGWVLDDVVALEAPVPCRGAQKLWNLPEPVAAEVQAQVQALRAGGRR